MKARILTSMFCGGFSAGFARHLREIVTERKLFAFVASDFEQSHERTDYYFEVFSKMFTECGIQFDHCCVVDGRMTKPEAQAAVKNADVVWLAGGDTPSQFRSIKDYGLDEILQNHEGVVIGMSAGAVNMAKTAVCTLTCGHVRQEIYQGLGLVEISVEPHFEKTEVSDEILTLSCQYPLYGLCDESVIICLDHEMILVGDVFFINHGSVEQLSFCD